MLYEYVCEPCGFKFEARKCIKDRRKANCPKCGSPSGKVMSVVNHSFGWRATDRSQERFGPTNEFERDI